MAKRKNLPTGPDAARRNDNLRKPRRCPYCGSPLRFVTAEQLKQMVESHPKRPKKASPFVCNHMHYYVCSNFNNCQSYIGAYENTYDPMGAVANPELRMLRIQTHLVFDEIWKNNILPKDEAYSLLGDKLNLLRSQTHISQFNKTNCEKTISIAEKILTERGIPIPTVSEFFANR